MTVPSPTGRTTAQQPLTAVPDDGPLAEAAAAARALAAALPSGAVLTAGAPTRDRPMAPAGQAACAHFGGTTSGEVVVVVGQDLIDALADTPMGALDLASAVQPALEAAVGTFGPVVVDPATVLEATAALDAMATTGAAVYVPLLDGDTVRAMLALIIGGKPAGGPVTQPPAAARRATPAAARSGLDLLHDVEMEVTAELGRTRMTVRELLSLTPGTIVELDRAAGSPADLLVNGRAIASGEVVIIDENFGLRITDIAGPGER
jgi:flagellar motor switch protein FliN/FliY